jgi:hypothetical protein
MPKSKPKQNQLAFVGPPKTNYRFSGHETFPCRYTWLPKAFIEVRDGNAFTKEEDAMVSLGVGKNMVRAARFWAQAAGIAEPKTSGGLDVTDFGRDLLAPEGGLDPFLEDIRSLWLIHWKISTHLEEPLFAWDFLLYRWPHPEFTRTEVLREFKKKAEQLERKLSGVTLEQHLDIFLHTYVPTRGRKGDVQEDNLDCPLIELDLLQKVGERMMDEAGRREPVYSFRREEKPDITPELFAYCLDDYWSRYHRNEAEIGFREVAFAQGSPGQVFKIPEWDLRHRLENLHRDSGGAFTYIESAAIPRVRRNVGFGECQLSAVYKPEAVYASN